MAKKVTNVEANANVNDANVVMTKTTAPEAGVVAEETAEEVAEEENSADDFFSSFFDDEDDNSSEKTTEEIIKELLASGTAKRLNGLTIKNVVAKPYDTHTLLTFVVKEYVVGDIASGETDPFGQPVMKLGKSHNVQSSSFAVAGIMKDTARTAVFAADVVAEPKLANILFAGGKLDVIMQYVAAGEEYVNPFARNAAPTVFERDKMIHHIVRLELGEVGLDKYHAMLNK